MQRDSVVTTYTKRDIRAVRNHGAESEQPREPLHAAGVATAQTVGGRSSTQPSGMAKRASPWTIVALSLSAVATWSFAWFGPTGIGQARWMVPGANPAGLVFSNGGHGIVGN